MRGRRLEMPEGWTTTNGLWLRRRGLTGTLFIADGAGERIVCHEGGPVVEVVVTDWSKIDAIDCFLGRLTPPSAQPRLRQLEPADLEPLIRAGSIDRIEALRLLSLTPGWQP